MEDHRSARMDVRYCNHHDYWLLDSDGACCMSYGPCPRGCCCDVGPRVAVAAVHPSGVVNIEWKAARPFHRFMEERAMGGCMMWRLLQELCRRHAGVDNPEESKVH